MKLFKTICLLSILACAAFFATAEVRTTTRSQTTYVGTLPFNGNPQSLLCGNGVFLEPGELWGLTAGYLPFYGGIGSGFFPSPMKVVTGSATNLATVGKFSANKLISTNAVTLQNVGANKVVMTDANSDTLGVTLGSHLSVSGGVLDTVSGGGNVTATPTADSLGRLAMFTGANSGTDIIPTSLFSDVDGNLIVDGNLTVNGTVTFPGGVSLATITAGYYFPTFTAVLNSSPPQAYATRYTRIGNVVNVDGRITFNVAASGTLTQCELSLPFPSDLAVTEDCVGQGARIIPSTTTGVNTQASVVAHITHNTALLTFIPLGTGTVTGDYTFHFTYVLQ